MGDIRIVGHALEMFTVYSNPSDYPGLYVARRWLVGHRVIVSDTDSAVLRSTNLEDLRDQLASKRLTPIARDPSDDPCIVETWI